MCLFLSRGNILLELMLASLIGMLLVSFLFDVYISANKSFRLQSDLNQIQDNAKAAIDIITSEIHQAGYIGCARLTNDFPIFGYQHYTINPQNKLIVTSSTVTVRHAGINSDVLIKPMQNRYSLHTNQAIRFKKDNILIISDCKQAEIFRVKNISHSHGIQIITPEMPLHLSFDGGAEVSRFEINHFFVAKSILYLHNIHGSKIKLVDGITNLHICNDNTVEKTHAVSLDLDVSAPTLNKKWYAYASI